MNQDMFDRVKKIVVTELEVEESLVTPNAHIKEDLGADSLDAVELVMAIEEEFKTVIPNDVAENIKTIQDILNELEKQGG